MCNYTLLYQLNWGDLKNKGRRSQYEQTRIMEALMKSSFFRNRLLIIWRFFYFFKVRLLWFRRLETFHLPTRNTNSYVNSSAHRMLPQFNCLRA